MVRALPACVQESGGPLRHGPPLFESPGCPRRNPVTSSVARPHMAANLQRKPLGDRAARGVLVMVFGGKHGASVTTVRHRSRLFQPLRHAPLLILGSTRRRVGGRGADSRNRHPKGDAENHEGAADGRTALRRGVCPGVTLGEPHALAAREGGGACQRTPRRLCTGRTQSRRPRKYPTNLVL